jgi:hypothetical protein
MLAARAHSGNSNFRSANQRLLSLTVIYSAVSGADIESADHGIELAV